MVSRKKQIMTNEELAFLAWVIRPLFAAVAIDLLRESKKDASKREKETCPFSNKNYDIFCCHARQCRQWEIEVNASKREKEARK